jgi:hypothetical protein
MDDILSITSPLGNSPVDLRDRALLLIGFASAFDVPSSLQFSDPFSALRAEMDSLFDSFMGGLPAFPPPSARTPP